MKKINEEVYYIESEFPTFGPENIAFLKAHIYKTPRKRLRICSHPDVSNILHEMFVIYSNETYVRPNTHRDKDESLNIIEGQADFIFFDNLGQIIESVQLDSKDNLCNFIRVPRNVWHTIIIKSPEIIIHEATTGPFDATQTFYADWAPAENTKEVKDYLNDLNRRLGIYYKNQANPHHGSN